MAKPDGKKDSKKSAKAKKDEGDEDYVFEMPDFDEDAFIHKELVSFKTTAILFVWGIVAAAVSWGIFEAIGGGKNGWYLGLVILAGFGVALKFVYPALKVDIDHFGRREWMGTGFLLFFTWLAFFILLTNPPFSDHAEPEVQIFVSPALQQAGGPLTYDVFIEDNVGIKEFTFALRQGSKTLATEDDLEDLGGGHFRYGFTPNSSGQFTHAVVAKDAKGNAASANGTTIVSAEAIEVHLPTSGQLGRTDKMVVDLRDARFLPLNVYLLLDDGTRLYLENERDEDDVAEGRNGEWPVFNDLIGWKEGNNTFSVVVETDHEYFGATRVPGTTIERGPFSIVVVDPLAEDKGAEPQGRETVAPNIRRTPDIGLPLIAVGLVAAVAVARRRD